MWSPNRRQWLLIWIAAVILILAWPPREGQSLAVKTVRWLADPRGDLPSFPEPLPMGVGDDGDAVAEHDLKIQEYYEFVEASSTNRLRLRLKDAEEPLEPATERQLLTAFGILAALGLWRLNGRAGRR